MGTLEDSYIHSKTEMRADWMPLKEPLSGGRGREGARERDSHNFGASNVCLKLPVSLYIMHVRGKILNGRV